MSEKVVAYSLRNDGKVEVVLDVNRDGVPTVSLTVDLLELLKEGSEKVLGR